MNKVSIKRYALKTIESILVIGFILFEEIIWNIFVKPIFDYFQTLTVLDAIKDRLIGLNRYYLVTLFIFNFGITEIMGVLSGISLLKGEVLLAIGVYALKIPVAVFTFWLFDLTKEKLMSFHWLKVSYDKVMEWVDLLTHSSVYLTVKKKVGVLRAKIRMIVKKYLGEGSFFSSARAQYLIFKSYVVKYF